MRVLIGKTFGIGNAVLSVPMVKAIKAAGHSVDVLVGTGPDDAGAREVLENLVGSVIDSLFFDAVPTSIPDYDVAVMSIPFDGRWKNRVHFTADRVIDGRSRPDPETFGFDSWKKHESEYQMENARELGYSGPTPSSSFRNRSQSLSDAVYLGIGYKKDKAGYWLQKHWGNENYSRFIEECCTLDRSLYFITTGNAADLTDCIAPIISRRGKNSRVIYQPTFGLQNSFDVVGSCGAYVGNDTGMMHVAASFNNPVFSMFGTYGDHGTPAIKSAPLSDRHIVNLFTAGTEQSPELIAEQFVLFFRSRSE